MARASDYAVVRERDGNYRINRSTEPFPAACAIIRSVCDRQGIPIGWKLKPLVCMQGSKSKMWTSAAEAIAATKLMTIGEARTAIRAADAAAGAS